MTICRNCRNILNCTGTYWKALECSTCGYVYEHPFKKRPTHDELIDAYEKEPWNKKS